MEVIKIDHVGVAVRDKERAAGFLTDVLGARKVLDEPWVYGGQEFNWAYFDFPGGGRIELISSPDEDNFINRFIARRGEGLHHITIQVRDLAGAVASLKAAGIEAVDVNYSDPNWKEAFIKPGDAFGVLIQLAEFDEDYWMGKAEA